MRLLDRYIGVTVAGSTLVVLAVLLALFSFGSFVTELNAVGKGDYTLTVAAEYVLLTLPHVTYQLFPVVALLGSVIGLGVLASNNELLVMRAAGISVGRITLAVMKVGLLWIIVAVILGEFVAPLADRYAQTMHNTALVDRFAITSQNGLWARDGENYIHIRDVFANGVVGGVTIYKLDGKQRLLEVTQARTGRFVDGEWRLRKVKRSLIDPAHIVTQDLKQLEWRSLLTPEMIDVVVVKPNSLSLKGLLDYIRYLRDNGLDAEHYQRAFWNKLIQPATTAVMVFLSIPFIFGPLRSVGVGQRIFVGALVGIGFYLLGQLFGIAGMLYHVPTALSAVLPTGLFFILGIMLMRRVR
ncbi:MAG: LPS export ABC transporter permease LptG [Gammaproteobacteria bacterium]|jgi:lipopolysaccharide export system permease protein